jgi:hypothetical protein
MFAFKSRVHTPSQSWRQFNNKLQKPRFSFQ